MCMPALLTGLLKLRPFMLPVLPFTTAASADADHVVGQLGGMYLTCRELLDHVQGLQVSLPTRVDGDAVLT